MAKEPSGASPSSLGGSFATGEASKPSSEKWKHSETEATVTHRPEGTATVRGAPSKKGGLGDRLRCEVHRCAGLYSFIIFLTSSHDHKIAGRQILSLRTNEIFRTHVQLFLIPGLRIRRQGIREHFEGGRDDRQRRNNSKRKAGGRTVTGKAATEGAVGRKALGRAEKNLEVTRCVHGEPKATCTNEFLAPAPASRRFPVYHVSC